ncbi:MAG: alpha/beta fold hydrolase, partial [Deltaproteobacteria bacterium]|nr:alpha/beta fold hydrolase [Deltaproteobacteria bacterium]
MKPWVRVVIAVGVLLLVALVALPFLRNTEHRDLDEAARSSAPGQFVQLSAGTTHYLLEGPEDGPPVVLVHGFSVPSYVWDTTASALVAEGYRVLRLDQYGRGWSDRPKATYDAEFLATQVRDLVDAVGFTEPFDLLGMSMGGVVVATFVERWPERVRRVALFDPVHEVMDVSVLTVPGLGEYVARVYWLPGLPDSQSGDFHRPERFADYPDRYREQMQFRGFGRALVSSARTVLAVDPRAHYEAVAAKGLPILLVWGEQDEKVPFDESSLALRDLLGAELLVVPEAGHVPHVE